MIILPSTPGMRRGAPRFVDAGITQRSPTQATMTRIDRGGAHWACEFELPPMLPDVARPFGIRLARAMSEGIRLPWLLMDVSQGSPGGTVVSGSGASGTSLPVRSGTAGYQAREGFWLNVVDSDGVHYLHQVQADATLNGSGAGTLSVWPPLRASLVDGNLIVLDTPKIEGLVTSPHEYEQPVTKRVVHAFTVEEAD